MLHNQNVDATVWPTFEFSDGINASTVLEVDPVRNELLDAATTVGSSSAARRTVCACLDGCAARARCDVATRCPHAVRTRWPLWSVLITSYRVSHLKARI